MILKLNEVSGKSLMEQALQGIREQVPFVRDARIQTISESKDKFVTKIEVFVKKQKKIIAVKMDSTPKLSIARALDAVLKQLNKIKEKNNKKTRKKMTFKDLESIQAPS